MEKRSHVTLPLTMLKYDERKKDITNKYCSNWILKSRHARKDEITTMNKVD